MSVFGSRVRRIEDRPLLTGEGRLVADITFPDQLHMRIPRSSIALGRLLGVESPQWAQQSPPRWMPRSAGPAQSTGCRSGRSGCTL